jgi:FG-GAP repeat protein
MRTRQPTHYQPKERAMRSRRLVLMVGLALGIATGPAQAQSHLEGSFFGSPGDFFGAAVALWGDTALVGAPLADVGGRKNQGAVDVFVRVNGVWTQQVRLVAADGLAGDQFGASVALRGDVALVGAPFDDVNKKTDQGAVYVFVRQGGAWGQQGKLVAAEGGAGTNFGASVALSASAILVGAPKQTVNGQTERGAVLAYQYSAGPEGVVVSTPQQLTAPDGAAGDHFGHSVALSGDTALVGAPLDDVGVSINQGAAYVFASNGASWAWQTTLRSIGGTNGDHLGWSVALDGNIAVVGAYGDDVAAFADQGAAYVFVGETGTWTELAQLVAADGAAGDQFGASVAVSNDRILVGAYGADGIGGMNRGAVYLFEGFGSSWSQIESFRPVTANSYAGWAVALSGDNLALGAPLAQSAGRADFSNLVEPAPAGVAASIALAPPPHGIREVYTVDLVTAIVRDGGGAPLSGVPVAFTGQGGESRCQTDTVGECSIAYGGPAFPSTDTIMACVFGTAICSTVTRTWVVPLATSGASDGSGRILPPGPSQAEVAFAFSASDAKGKCNVKDDNAGVTVRCLDVVSYVSVDPHAFFYGSAVVNGVPTTYRLDVNDGGKSGGAVDTFTLVTGNGYALAGTVVQGNVQVQAP